MQKHEQFFDNVLSGKFEMYFARYDYEDIHFKTYFVSKKLKRSIK